MTARKTSKCLNTEFLCKIQQNVKEYENILIVRKFFSHCVDKIMIIALAFLHCSNENVNLGNVTDKDLLISRILFAGSRKTNFMYKETKSPLKAT